MLSKGENHLIKIISIFFFSGSLASLFLQVFLFRLGGFSTVALFNLIQLAFLLLLYISSGWLLKKFSTRTLLRVSLLIFSFAWLFLIILGERSIHHLILLGIIFGSGQGLFWSSFNLSQYILTHQKRREAYFGKSSSFSSIASAFGPIIGGIIVAKFGLILGVSYAGYYSLFLIVFVLNAMIFILAQDIPEHKGINFQLAHIFNHQRSRHWKLVLSQQFILGLYDAGFSAFSGIILFTIIRQESTLGFVQTAIGLITAVSSFIAGRMLSRNKKLYVVGAIGAFVGIFLFSYLNNWIGIYFFIFFTGLCSPYLNIPLSAGILNGIDTNKEKWQNKYHMLLERDISLGIARILSYVILFILFTFWDKSSIALNWMSVISVIPLLLGFLLYLMSRLGDSNPGPAAYKADALPLS